METLELILKNWIISEAETDRQADPECWWGEGGDGRIHSADVCWDFGAEQEDCACVRLFIKTKLDTIHRVY